LSGNGLKPSSSTISKNRSASILASGHFPERTLLVTSQATTALTQISDSSVMAVRARSDRRVLSVTHQ
jgi:hypothetical protein